MFLSLNIFKLFFVRCCCFMVVVFLVWIFHNKFNYLVYSSLLNDVIVLISKSKLILIVVSNRFEGLFILKCVGKHMGYLTQYLFSNITICYSCSQLPSHHRVSKYCKYRRDKTFLYVLTFSKFPVQFI